MTLSDFGLPEQWRLQSDGDAVAQYANAAGDLLSINFYPAIPDIPVDVSDVQALRSCYRSVSESYELALLEVETAEFSGVPAIRTLLKARLDPTGFGFIGSFTLPFADHSYVIKVQSLEEGITGVREAAVLMMSGFSPEVDEKTGKMIGWEQDPYDPGYQGAFMSNRADHPRYDAQFPDHPLSKARGYLNELAGQLRLAPAITRAKLFQHRAKSSGFWSWWRR